MRNVNNFSAEVVLSCPSLFTGVLDSHWPRLQSVHMMAALRPRLWEVEGFSLCVSKLRTFVPKLPLP